MARAIDWFEIPVSKIQRAETFYSQIFGIEFDHIEKEGLKLAMFPTTGEQTGGALVQGSKYKPSAEGPTIYLNAGADLQNVLDRISDAGGTVIAPKKSIGEWGYTAHFIDSEGNRIALHSDG